MKEIKLYDAVALLDDLPEHNLWRGQVGAIVENYNNGEAFEVEFVDTSGNTYGLVTLKPIQFIVLSHEPVEIAA
jgi:hypothetical protein